MLLPPKHRSCSLGDTQCQIPEWWVECCYQVLCGCTRCIPYCLGICWGSQGCEMNQKGQRALLHNLTTKQNSLSMRRSGKNSLTALIRTGSSTHFTDKCVLWAGRAALPQGTWEENGRLELFALPVQEVLHLLFWYISYQTSSSALTAETQRKKGNCFYWLLTLQVQES